MNLKSLTGHYCHRRKQMGSARAVKSVVQQELLLLLEVERGVLYISEWRRKVR